MAALMVLATLTGTLGASAHVSHASEQCGRWTVSFNWSDADVYKKSVSEADNEDNGVRTHTDTLTMTSVEDPMKVIKVGIVKYSKWNSSLAQQSNLMSLAKSLLIKSGSCKDVRLISGEIDRKPGIIGSGSGCKGSEVLHVAVYCVDGSNPAIAPSTLAVILSSYDGNSTDRLVNSLQIE